MVLPRKSAIPIHEAAHFVVGEMLGLRATSIQLNPVCCVKWEPMRQSDLITDVALTMFAAGEAANLKQLQLLGEVDADAQAYARYGAQGDVSIVLRALENTSYAGSISFYSRGLERASRVMEGEGVWEAILQVATAIDDAMNEDLLELDLLTVRRLFVHLLK